jgi:(1->4)-alpha-D-glucan 1-alpha-D-glucosylmutase
VFAFARRTEDRWAIVAAPRLLTRLIPDAASLPLGADVWQDTRLLVPGLAQGAAFRNVFTGERRNATDESGQATLPLAEVFAHFPVALLVSEQHPA